MQRFRVALAGGTHFEVDDHEMALIRATAAAALAGEATPIISIMVIGPDGTNAEGPMINVLQVVTIETLAADG